MNIINLKLEKMSMNQKRTKDEWEIIKVTFPDGTVIENDIVRETYEETILRLGVEKVFQLKIDGIKKRNILLVDNHPTKEEPYCRDQREIAPGYYLLSYNNTLKKAQLLEEMSEKLNAHLKIEIITPDSSRLISSPFVYPSKPKGRCGQIVNSDGVWKFNTGDKPVSESYTTLYIVNHEDVAEVAYTDHFTPDTLIIRHDGKYGVYSLPGLGDYGNDGTLEWISQSGEAFPYDDVRVLGFNMRYFGFIAYRLGNRWGVDSAIYAPLKDRVIFESLLPCKYSSLAEAEKEMPKWRDPYDEQ